MTAQLWPGRLLTLAEFAALPEDNSYRYELDEGVLIASPRPIPLHQRVINNLVPMLNDQLPEPWEAFSELEVVVDDHDPGIVRVPDVVVGNVDLYRSQVPASDVVLLVEVISAGSRRRDTRIKPMDYAEAGIPHYWVVDLDPPASIAIYHLAGTFYQEAPAVTRELVVSEPLPLRIDIPALVAPRQPRSQG